MILIKITTNSREKFKALKFIQPFARNLFKFKQEENFSDETRLLQSFPHFWSNVFKLNVLDGVNIINKVKSNHDFVINCKICLIFNYFDTLLEYLNSLHVSFHKPAIGKFNFPNNTTSEMFPVPTQKPYSI